MEFESVSVRKRVRRQRDAARRSGMSVGEWLNTVIQPADEEQRRGVVVAAGSGSIANPMSDSSSGPDTTSGAANGIVRPLRPGAVASASRMSARRPPTRVGSFRRRDHDARRSRGGKSALRMMSRDIATSAPRVPATAHPTSRAGTGTLRHDPEPPSRAAHRRSAARSGVPPRAQTRSRGTPDEAAEIRRTAEPKPAIAEGLAMPALRPRRIAHNPSVTAAAECGADARERADPATKPHERAARRKAINRPRRSDRRNQRDDERSAQRANLPRGPAARAAAARAKRACGRRSPGARNHEARQRVARTAIIGRAKSVRGNARVEGPAPATRPISDRRARTPGPLAAPSRAIRRGMARDHRAFAAPEIGGLEGQLRQITARIEALAAGERTAKRAIEGLRTDLAEIGRSF